MPTLSEVFIAGGQPTLTYNPRSSLNLEQRFRDYLSTLHKVLSVSGPTKSGKTVLVRSIIPRNEGFWVSGGQLESAEMFWQMIVQQAGGFTSISTSDQTADQQTRSSELSGRLKLPGVAGGTKASESTSTTRTTGLSSSRTVPAGVAGPTILLEQRRPLVIDDFHYLAPEVQEQIVRSLKDAVYEGVPVILLSVPHRAYDAVRVEREMTGRVTQLEVPLWEPNELAEIAEKGFDALRVNTLGRVVKDLAEQSFQSPHLMQDFCSALCRDNGVYATQAELRSLAEPSSWELFFRSRAADTSKMAFDRLAQGPRQRSDRLPRKLTDGQTVDIYTLILLGIAKTGPKTRLSYEDIRGALRDILFDTMPRSNEITAVLEHMTAIAKTIPGEPVVEWDKEYSTLHVTDPFFAYYLRWGTKIPDRNGSLYGP
jgi:hypothetical protein